MTSHSWLLQPRTLGVFDIETMPDEAAVAVAAYRGSRMPTALQRIATACMLVASERPDGSWTDFRIDTFTEPLSEFLIVMGLDEAFADLARCGGAIVTFNGRNHDLAVLRRRAARHWAFGLPGLSAATTIDHLDVMLRQQMGRRDPAPSLRDACAALGIQAFDPRTPASAARASARSPRRPIDEAPGSDDRKVAPAARKCQTDVVATFILALYEMAMERGSPDVLIAGWEGLSRHLAGVRPRPLHLEHFRDHPLLRAAAKARIRLQTSN